MFGKSSEQIRYIYDSEQLSFFNEAEQEYSACAPEPTKETLVASHTKKAKRTKAEITENLEHKEIICDLEDKHCPECGEELICIGKEFVRSELNIIPAQVFFKKHLIFSKRCGIIYTEKEIKFLPCSIYYSFYNPTLLIREFSSVCGLQTSRYADEGSENHSGVYPPASCGFYSLYERQGGFFIFSDLKLLCMQKLFLKVIVLKRFTLLSAFIPLFLWSCTDKSPVTRDIFSMDTYMNIKAYGVNADIAINSAENEIYRLEKNFSVTDENSEVYKLNHSQGKAITVCDDMKKLIDFSTDMCRETGGLLDISAYPVSCLWGFTTDEFNIPTQEEINEKLEYVDYSKINIYGNEITLPYGFEIDLGAVAKGYTSDRIADILIENGIESAIINLGGNVHALGKKPDGSLWNVAVANPFSPAETLGTVQVTDKAVVTSGNYQRYFTGDNGKNYCHIINPFTGYPAESGLVSVTVIGENGALCDALSTALFVMGKEKAVEYMKNQPDLSYILVEEKGNITISENISSYFEISVDFPLEVADNEH